MGTYQYGFVTRLPQTQGGSDTIWVIVDRLTKTVHFLPMTIKASMEKLVQLYIDNVVSLHGVPVSIICDRDPRFTSRFWTAFQQAMSIEIQISTMFHP